MAKYTQDDLTTLKSALMSGAQSVTVGDRSITLRSKEELLALIDIVEKDLAGDTSSQALENTSVIVSGFSRKGE